MFVRTTRGVCEIPDPPSGESVFSIASVLHAVMDEATRPVDCCNAGTELIRPGPLASRILDVLFSQDWCALRPGDEIEFFGQWRIGRQPGVFEAVDAYEDESQGQDRFSYDGDYETGYDPG